MASESRATRRTPTIHHITNSAGDLDSEIGGEDFSRYTVHLPPTPDNQPMPMEIAMQAVGSGEQYVSSSMFTGGYNRVTRAHSKKIVDSDPATVVAEGSFCELPGCGAKMLTNRQGIDVFPCECGFRICNECYRDALATGDGFCPGCREHYRGLDLSEMAPASRTRSSKSDRSFPVAESTELLMRNHSNEFDYTQYLYETNKSYGYGNAVWPMDGANGSRHDIGGDTKFFHDKQWKPLTQKSSIRAALLSPYRLLILIRIVVLGLFLEWRISHPNEEAIWLWLMSDRQKHANFQHRRPKTEVYLMPWSKYLKETLKMAVGIKLVTNINCSINYVTIIILISHFFYIHAT